MAKIRVLYIHQDGLITGSAISLKYFLQAMNRDIFEPIVLLADDGPARNLYEELNIKVHVFKFKTLWTSPGPNWYSPSNLKQVRAFFFNRGLYVYVKKLAPDVIHINDKAALNAGISLKKMRVPIVQHSRSTYKDALTKINTYVSAFFIKKNSDAVIAISEDEADLLEDAERFCIINNTISNYKVGKAISNKDEIRKELDIADKSIVISFVSALSSSKGVFSFLDLAKKLLYKFKSKSIVFLLVGNSSNVGNTILEDGSVKKLSVTDFIKKYISEISEFGNIKLLGFRSDALSIMAGSNILVVPNKIGVMGRQPIEAQALGIPVVVAQGHSGKSTIVKDGEGGIVINSPVDMDELVAAVEKLINNPELREEMGERGRIYAKEKFNPETNMRKIEAIYMELLNERKGNDN